MERPSSDRRVLFEKCIVDASIFISNQCSNVVGVLVCDLAEIVVFCGVYIRSSFMAGFVLVVGGGLFVGVVVSV